MRALARLVALSPHRRKLLAQAVVWLIIARAGIALVPLQKLRALLERSPRPGNRGASIEDLRWSILAAARRLPGCRCLARSLALQAMLRRAGISSTFNIGVAKHADGRFAAHAWIEADGRPVLSDELGPYTLIPLPAPARR